MRPPRPNRYRDAWCGELRGGASPADVRVAGWVHRRRDHGGLIFIDLRDRSGIVQLVFAPGRAPQAHERAHALRAEDVLSAAGRIAPRSAENVNPNIPTGEIEVEVEDFELLADADPPPFPIDEDGFVEEPLRLRHRALDLRRTALREAMLLRHRITRAIRDHLDANDFVEIETPLLTRSTPEGARDYLVPARIAPGSFYALPQSPQLFKQLLMVGGLERYYQIARCFRDEDSRADRLPEFTQLDLEMSFVDEDDVITTVEALLASVFEAAPVAGLPTPPYERITYDEALARYGTDRADRRFGLEIVDLSEALRESEFQVFAGALRSGGVVRALNAGARELSRSELDELTEHAKGWGAKGLVWAFVEADGSWRSPIAKFLSADEIAAMTKALAAKPGELVLAVADAETTVAQVLGLLRLELADRFELVPAGRHDLHWVVDFPMFEWREGEGGAGGGWESLHHPFTAPAGDLTDPATSRSRAYDVVFDGSEIGGGSIRIHSPDLQRQVFELLGISEGDAQERFGFLLDALRYGAPPHGGIAFGLDRIIALVAGRESIRDVIAFPKATSGADPLTGAPAPVDQRQLRELGLGLLRPPSSD